MLKTDMEKVCESLGLDGFYSYMEKPVYNCEPREIMIFQKEDNEGNIWQYPYPVPNRLHPNREWYVQAAIVAKNNLEKLIERDDNGNR